MYKLSQITIHQEYDTNNDFAPEMCGTLTTEDGKKLSVLVRYLSEDHDCTELGSESREGKMTKMASKYVNVLSPLFEENMDHVPIKHSGHEDFIAVKAVVYHIPAGFWRLSDAKSHGLLSPELTNKICDEIMTMVKALHHAGIIHTHVCQDCFLIDLSVNSTDNKIYLDRFFRAYHESEPLTGHMYTFSLERETAMKEEEDMEDTWQIISYLRRDYLRC